jgi:hypothetical protein
VLYRFAKNAASAAKTATKDEKQLFFICAACRGPTTNQQLEPVADQ